MPITEDLVKATTKIKTALERWLQRQTERIAAESPDMPASFADYGQTAIDDEGGYGDPSQAVDVPDIVQRDLEGWEA